MSLKPAQYYVKKIDCPAPLELDAAHWSWLGAQVAPVSHFHQLSSAYRPQTQIRVLHDTNNLYVHFDVADRYVRCTHLGYQDSVCNDSCVEFFVQPLPDKGYFNFELNCGGTMMLMYNEDAKLGARAGRYCSVWPEHAQQIRIRHSMPRVVQPEITEPVNWRLAMSIPMSIFEHYVGPVLPVNGQPWRANFFKCADGTSHPHWASWSPINGQLNFHQPQFFGQLLFES